MASTACLSGRLSRSQAATTWQSFSAIRPRVLSGPIIPQPTMPMTMRSEGAGRPSLPRALEGINVGAATAAALVAMKRRREILEIEGFIMGGIMTCGQFGREWKNASQQPGHRLAVPGRGQGPGALNIEGISRAKPASFKIVSRRRTYLPAELAGLSGARDFPGSGLRRKSVHQQPSAFDPFDHLDQLVEASGLHQIRVGPQFMSLGHVRDLVGSRQDDDNQFSQLGLVAN